MSLSDDAIERYARHLILREVGGAGQQKLLAARVLLIGAGGIGSPLALYLAAAGVGTIGLIDDDRVALSNLQRQIAHRTADLGRLKVESAADAMHRLNPETRVIALPERLTTANAAALFADFDLVADGSDNFETRFAANDAAFAAKRTLVSAAIGEFDGQLSTFKAHQRGEGGGQRFPCYRCLLPEPPAAGAVPTCSEAGVIGALTGIMGAWAALEIIKEILGIGESLAGRLVLFDGLGGAARTVRLKPDPQCRLCA